jgi:hypothetical protein
MTLPANVAALRRKYVRATSRDRWGEAAAVAVLLSFEPISDDPRFASHVTRDGIDWDALLAESWSPAEQLLIGTAAGIWSGSRTLVDISRVTRLGDDFFGAWTAMIRAMDDGHVPGEVRP